MSIVATDRDYSFLKGKGSISLGANTIGLEMEEEGRAYVIPARRDTTSVADENNSPRTGALH